MGFTEGNQSKEGQGFGVCFRLVETVLVDPNAAQAAVSNDLEAELVPSDAGREQLRILRGRQPRRVVALDLGNLEAVAGGKRRVQRPCHELGDGIIPLEPIMVAAKAAGAKHCHVEQDQSPDPIASIRQSMEYLKKL